MPRAIAAVGLDAGRTLIDVREPVGETYARHARELGFAVDVAGMERGFTLAFAAAPPLAAPPGTSGAPLLEFERGWWASVVASALDHALDTPGRARASGRAFDRLFDDLFEYYATPAGWRLFPDALPALEEIARRDLAVAILSNFDARLHRLVDALGLRPYVAAVVVSSEAGATKPSAVAFAALARALAEAKGAPAGALSPEAVLHVGDSLEEDARGAVASGLHAAWLVRDGAADLRSDAERNLPIARIASLRELPGLIDALGAVASRRRP